MPIPSRRTFLVGAGSGAVAATVISPASAAAAADTDDLEGLTTDEPVVAYVRDVASGEISVMSGDREVVFSDRALAAQLARTVV